MAFFEICGALSNVFGIIGLMVCLFAALSVCLSIYKNLSMFFFPGSGFDPRKYGQWAVVTGATDGIGKAYVEQLASKGMNIFLLSRSADKLKDLASQIEQQYGVRTKTQAVDFTGGVEIYSGIGAALAGLDVGVLVNNVGMSYRFPQYFCELPDAEKFLPTTLNINCLSTVMMTYLVLPGMEEKGRGVIINIASDAGSIPIPLLTVYSAAKVFVDFFSRALNKEYGPKGILIQSVLPGYVATKMSKIRQETFTTPGPRTFVESALKTVGSQDRTNGCFAHNIQGWMTDHLPEWVLDRYFVPQLKAVREMALKRLEQKRQKAQKDN